MRSDRAAIALLLCLIFKKSPLVKGPIVFHYTLVGKLRFSHNDTIQLQAVGEIKGHG